MFRDLFGDRLALFVVDCSGVVWEWHYGDQWNPYDEVTEKSLEMAFHGGLNHVTLSTAVCSVGAFFSLPDTDGRYSVTLKPDEAHHDVDQSHLPQHLRLETGLPPNADAWIGLSQLNVKTKHRRPVRRIRLTDLTDATDARMQEMCQVVLNAFKDQTGDPYEKTSSIGLNSPMTPTKTKPELEEMEQEARLEAYDMRHTFDHLGLTHSDLEVANTLSHMVADTEGKYSVLGLLKQLRTVRRAAKRKSDNLENSKRKSGKKLGGKVPRSRFSPEQKAEASSRRRNVVTGL